MSEKTKERPELTFDGFGINGPDEYRTRLCKFNHMDYPEADCQKYGHLFAAAPEMLEALKAIAARGGNLPDPSLTSRTGPNDAALRGAMYCTSRAIALAAIAKAEGRQS